MSTITKQWLQQTIAEMEEHRDLFPGDLDDNHGRVLAALRIALASLEAEPVAYMYKDNLHADARFSLHTRFGNWSQEDINEYEITEIPLYTAPPAPVSVPDAIHSQGEKSASDDYYALGWNACRAAMLQGADGALTNEDTKRVDELVIWIKRLAHSLRKAKPDSKLQSDAMDYLSRNGLIGVEDILR
ncbi:hypothetical protein ACX2OA_002180 [Enterobacter hormaechei]